MEAHGQYTNYNMLLGTRHILGIDSGVQSHTKATPRPHQSHTKATPKPPPSHTKATPRLGESVVRDRIRCPAMVASLNAIPVPGRAGSVTDWRLEGVVEAEHRSALGD